MIGFTEMPCLPKIEPMNQFGKRLSEHLGSIGMTKYRLAKLSGVPESSVINIANGKRAATDDVLMKFGQVADLKVGFETLKSWRLLDDYSPQMILQAYEILAQSDPQKYGPITEKIAQRFLDKREEKKRQK